jgi:hypothetical protein
MNNWIKAVKKRLRRAIWVYKQPLTLVPTLNGAPVSDLFLWRNSNEWETFFELIDMQALFTGAVNAGRSVKIIFFDAKGRLFLEKSVNMEPFRRKTLAVSEIIGNVGGEYGTFAVFHSHTPKELTSIGSHLAERGYLSYRHRQAPLRAYVHGNLDAVAHLSDHCLQLLGGRSLLQREFRLQHILARQGVYELGIVNPTVTNQAIICQKLSGDRKVIGEERTYLPPRGSHFFRIMPTSNQNWQWIVLRSRLVMARPIIFRLENDTADVFHG